MHATLAILVQTAHHAHHARGGILGYFMRLGPLGLLLVSVIDSSPIPLPIPGSSDLLVTVFAAQNRGWLFATLIATLGSAIGCIASYQLGVVGGVTLLDKYAPRRFADRLKHWSEHHAMLSVALPAILPPPAPLMPFLIAAGALRMPRRIFYPTFIVSRFARHALYAWLGVHYGRHILPLYNRITEQYGWILLLVVWGSIAFAIVYAATKLIQARRANPKRKAAAIATA